MQIFMDNFHQGRKYSAQMARHQAKLRREGKFADQKSLSISSLQTDYLNLDNRSGCGKHNKRQNIVQTNCNICGGTKYFAERCFKRIRKEKIISCVW